MIRIIYTIMQDGICLMPRVLEGVISQTIPCCLMPITSRRDWSKSAEVNRKQNWEECFSHCNEDIFVGMDSDVVLIEPTAIEILVNELEADEGLSMTAIGAKKRNGTFHQLYAIRRKDFFEFDEDPKQFCIICDAMDKMEQDGKRIKHIREIQLTECPRKFVRRRNIG